MTTQVREDDIRASANATDACPATIQGVSLDVCSTITNASQTNISSRVYGVPPSYTVQEDTLPSGLQTKINECNVDGACHFVAYDFETDTGTKVNQIDYLVDSRMGAMENTAIVIKTISDNIVSAVSYDGLSVTVTTVKPHYFQVNGTVTLDVSPYVGTFRITSVPSATTFTYENEMCPEGTIWLFSSSSVPQCVKKEVYNPPCKNEGQDGSYFRKRRYDSLIPEYTFSGKVSYVNKCVDLLLYTIPSPELSSTSVIKYVPPEIPTYSGPPGYDYNSLAIQGNQIGGTITNATEMTCAQTCTQTGGCVGFNISTLSDTCQMFSMVTASVAAAESSFRVSSNSNLLTPGPPGMGGPVYRNTIIDTKLGYKFEQRQRLYFSGTQMCPASDLNTGPIGWQYRRICGFTKSLTWPYDRLCESYDPNASGTTVVSVTDSGPDICRNICKNGYSRDVSGICIPCPATAQGDTGTIPAYTSGCSLISCTTSDQNASGATIVSGVCRNTCRYQKSSDGSCVPCPPPPTGDPGTSVLYSPTGCTVSGCVTDALNTSSATLDASGACRNVCDPGYLKNSSGSCVSCPPPPTGDPGTSQVYSSGCTISGCQSSAPNTLSATLDASGACRNVCAPGYLKNSTGSCVSCPPPPTGDTGTSVVGYVSGCTVKCSSSDPNATIGQEAIPDSSGACRNNCRELYTRDLTTGQCIRCPVNLNGDPGTYISQSPGWISNGGACTGFLCLTSIANGLGGAVDANGNCKNRCIDGYKLNSDRSACLACPNPLPTNNDVNTKPMYISYKGTNSWLWSNVCDIYCIGKDPNSTLYAGTGYGATPDASGNCRVECKSGYTRDDTTGTCTACTGLNGWGDAGTSVISFSSGCVVSGCATTDPNASGAGYTTFYKPNGDCVNYCKSGFQRDFTNNQRGKCTACPTLNNTGGDPGTTISYTASGTCSAFGCTTTDVNASGASPDASGVCRNTCKPGYTRNSSGICVACTTSGDTGTTVTVYSSGCSASTCSTTDTKASGAAPDASGVCRNTCISGFVRNSAGTCVTCATLGDVGTLATSLNGCTALACSTTDANATGAAPDSSGVCRNTCKPGYTRNSVGTCITCVPTKDQGTTVTSYSSGCNALTCSTSDMNATGAAPDSSGICRNTCKGGYTRNANGTCVTCTFSNDFGTTGTSFIGCFITNCTTTDVNAVLAQPDASGTCRNVCKAGYKSGGTASGCAACSTLYRVIYNILNSTDSSQINFSTTYNLTTSLVGRYITIIKRESWQSDYSNLQFKITAQTPFTFIPSDVTTYGIASNQGTILTAKLIDSYGNLIGGSPMLNNQYINQNFMVCPTFYQMNCVVGDAYTTTTYNAGTCSILQCSTTDSNATSVASDGTACRKTCAKNYEKNTVGMCVLKQCQTTDTNSPGAYLVNNSCMTLCNLSYYFDNGSKLCQTCGTQKMVTNYYKSDMFESSVGAQFYLSTDTVATPGMVIQWDSNRYKIANVISPYTWEWWMSAVPYKTGYIVDVVSIDKYGSPTRNPLEGNINYKVTAGPSSLPAPYKSVYLCNSL